MSLPLLFLILLLLYYALAGLVFVLHYLSERVGLAPLFILLGTLTAALQLRYPGAFQIPYENTVISLQIGSLTFTPLILLGLLLIYIYNGTHQARMALAGVTLVTALLGMFMAFPSLETPGFGGTFSIAIKYPSTPAIMISSLLSFAIDFVVVILIYQGLSNWRRRFPSRLAATLALLAAAFSDALIFPLLSYRALPQLTVFLLMHLAGKTTLALALAPLLSYYFHLRSTRRPSLAAGEQRPTLNLFNSTVQLEARARYHRSLLRTMSQINQLILRTDDPQTLLDQACALLVSERDYRLAWIGLATPGQDSLCPNACAAQTQDGDKLRPEAFSITSGPVGEVFRSGRAVLISDTRQAPEYAPWQEHARRWNYHTTAAFPLRRAGQVLGVLMVHAAPIQALDGEEIDLLQELADDLAYALISLEARQQQIILHTAAETMQDGLLIMDMEGKMLYANPAYADLMQRPVHEIIGGPFHDLIPSVDRQALVARFLQQLRTHGAVAFDHEHQLPGYPNQSFAISAALVPADPGNASYIVANLRDITSRRRFETHLLNLNRFITDMVMAHRIPDLAQVVFVACENLLAADACAIDLLNGQNDACAECYSANLPPGYATRLIIDLEDMPGKWVLQNGQPIGIGDTLSDPAYQDRLHFLADYGLRALVLAPIQYQDQTIGLLSVYNKQARQFSAGDMHLALTLAQTSGIAIQNIRLFEAELTQRHFAEALSRATVSVNTSLDLEQVIDHILEQTIQVIECQAANVMLIQDHVACVMRAVDRRSGELAFFNSDRCLPLTLPTLQHMLSSSQPLIVANTAADPLWHADGPSAWIQSYAAAPLIVQDEIIGFLNMNSDAAQFFGPAIKARVQAFASTAATAIQNARLYRDLQRHSRVLEERVSERTLELSLAKNRIERILLAVPDAVFVLDDQDRQVQANPAGEALRALADSEGLDLFDHEYLAEIRASAVHRIPAIIEIQERAYQALASSLPAGDDQFCQVVVFRDVTRFQELDRMKTRFISDVSHELRTPLTNLSLYIDLLAAVTDKNRQESYLDTLRRETERLTHLIEDLLTISRLEAGRIEISLKPVDITHLVADLTRDRVQMAERRQLTLTNSAGEGLPAAQTDARLLSQVLSNLLTNALNYTPKSGNIHIHSDRRSNPDGEWVIISVQDSGVGISPAEQQRLFERFFRGSASEHTGAPGTGLGLAISKEIIERMQGHITVNSQTGAGSTFTVWLPAVL